MKNVPPDLAELLADANSRRLDGPQLLTRLAYQFGHFRMGAHRFNSNDLARIDIHSIGPVQLLAPLHEYIAHLLCIRVGLTDHVVDVGEDRMRTPITCKLAKIGRAVGKQHALVRRIKLHIRPAEMFDDKHPRNRDTR